MVIFLPENLKNHERAWFDKIEVRSDGCWYWTGSVDSKGYGRVKFRGRVTGTHRAFYIILREDPGELQIDHLCRNKVCVNPEHLEAVTQQENIARKPFKLERYCPSGHPYVVSNTAYSGATASGRGGHARRVCRTCKYLRDRKRALGKNKRPPENTAQFLTDMRWAPRNPKSPVADRPMSHTFTPPSQLRLDSPAGPC